MPSFFEICYLLFFFYCIQQSFHKSPNRCTGHIRRPESFLQYFRCPESRRRDHQIHLCLRCTSKVFQCISHRPGRQNLPSRLFHILYQCIHMLLWSEIERCHTKKIHALWRHFSLSFDTFRNLCKCYSNTIYIIMHAVCRNGKCRNPEILFQYLGDCFKICSIHIGNRGARKCYKLRL